MINNAGRSSVPPKGELDDGPDESDIKMCPCQEFRTAKDIRRCLDAEKHTSILVEWLSSAGKSGSSYDCLSYLEHADVNHCPHRVGSAFAVLNAIRDACRHHLESAVSSIRSTADQGKASTPETYEEAFPSLGGSASPPREPSTNTQAGGMSTTRTVTKAKPMRRIRPAPALERPTGTSVWGTSLTPSMAKGNISTLPSETPLMLKHPHGTTQQRQRASKKPSRRIAPTLMASHASPDTSTTNVWNNAPINGAASKVPSEVSNTNPPHGRSFPHTEHSLDTARAGKAPASEGDVPRKEQKFVKGEGKCTSREAMDKMIEESMEKQLDRLVEVYSATIHQHLVPSTVMEFHLLIRLLAVPDHSQSPDNNTDSNPFASLFRTGKTCRMFAAESLYRCRGLLCSLGFHVVQALTECPPFRKRLPELTEQLSSVAYDMRHKALLLGVDSVNSNVGISQTPMLTLPFDQERDSRHNYKSREASVMYKNREETRDGFLYQLRNFQNVRGRVLDVTHVNRSLQKIRLASRDMVRTIFPSNLVWFTQFFCDLLLQIGLVPMEETDKEILNITDKDKLQKLHRRFSSKEGKPNKSSQKLSLEAKNQTGSTVETFAEPQQHFPGHQEFFLIFLQSADSYAFGVQLKHRLVEILAKFADVRDEKGLEQRLLKMQVLARFMGFMVFSPYWFGAHKDSPGFINKAPDSSPPDVVSLLSLVQPALPFDSYIEKAWEHRRLVTVVPWLVEFLRMIRWDRMSQSTPYYKRLLGLLRTLQIESDGEKSVETRFELSNVGLVSNYLETLFSDVIGLGRTCLLPRVELPSRKQPEEKGGHVAPLDTSPFVLSKNFLVASTPHLEELFALLSTLNDTSKKRTVPSVPASPRKMRPHVLSRPALGISKLSFGEAYSSAEVNAAAATTSAVLDNQNQFPNRHGGSIQRKLVDAFFHQHKDVKEICDFVVDRTLKHLSLILPQKCIMPSFEKALSSVTEESTLSPSIEKALVQAETDSVIESREVVKKKLETSVRESLLILGPADTHTKVREIATKLTLAHASQLGEAVILALVREEMSRRRNAMGRARPEPSMSEPRNSAHEDAELIVVVNSLDRLACQLVAGRGPRMDPVLLESLSQAKSSLKSLVASESGVYRTREGSWPFRFSGTKLDPCGPCFVALLESCLNPSYQRETRWPFVIETIGIAALLAKAQLCNRVRKNITAFFSRDHQLENLIEVGIGEELDPCIVEPVGQLLIEMLRVTLIDILQLEKALLYSLNDSDPSGAVSRYCLESLTNRECDALSVNGDVMPQLKRTLENLNRTSRS